MALRKFENNHVAINSEVLAGLYISLRRAMEQERKYLEQGGEPREFYERILQTVIPGQGLIDLSAEYELNDRSQSFAGFVLGILTAQRLREVGMNFNIEILVEPDKFH